MPTVTPEQVLVGYATAVKDTRARILKYAGLVWAGSSAYRDEDIDRIVAQIAPKVQAGQMQIANLTAAYIASVATLRRGSRVAPAVVQSYVTLGRGVPATEVYRRPAKTLYGELAKGTAFDEAVAAGASRLQDLVSMDMQMAKVRQVSDSYTSAGVQYFARVLTGAEDCALCVIASTQRYSTGDLMPIHPGCDCDVEELDDDTAADFAEVNTDLLAETHDRVEQFAGVSDAGGRAPDYKNLIVTREHGEYGPTLTWRSDKFTGPGDLSTGGSKPRPARGFDGMTADQVRNQIRILEGLSDTDYKAKQLPRLRARLAAL